jgi:DNA-binding MarR family transcriptional regulator
VRWPDILARQGQTFGFLLISAGRLADEAAQAKANARLGQRLARPALMRLVPFLSPEGARITELARRLDVSKQAVQKSCADLVRMGFAVLKDDDDDGRARRVCLTPAGVKSYALGLACLDELERELRAKVGDATLDRLKRDLGTVLAALSN